MTLTGLERELQEFWCDYEASVGFKSTFSAMLAAHAGVSMGSGPPVGWDPYAEAIDAIRSGSKTYRALRRMETPDVVVLYRLYGPRNSRAEHAALGVLSPLAVLTDAVEDARCDIVLEKSTPRAEASGARTKAEHARRREELVADFWREVGAIAKAASRYERARTPARAAEHEQRVEAGWALLGQILDAYAVDGVVRARIGAIESTDREITSQEALRHRLRPTKDGEGTKRQADFVAEVTREAERMRRRALDAYRAARYGRAPAKTFEEAVQEAVTPTLVA